MTVGSSYSKYELNPISKLLIVLVFGVTVMQPLQDAHTYMIVALFAGLYCLYGMPKKAVKTTMFFGVLLLILGSKNLDSLSPVLQMFVSVIIIIKMFYLPVMAGRFFLATSDVGSIITSMDKLKIPMSFSIPISVMFRFFPSFREEHEHIKMAMKVRGITIKKPFCYLEYVSIPLLVLSSNITDEIAKAAETKCIADPVKKTRFRQVRFGLVDGLFILVMVGIQIVGRL